MILGSILQSARRLKANSGERSATKETSDLGINSRDIFIWIDKYVKQDSIKIVEFLGADFRFSRQQCSTKVKSSKARQHK